MISKPLPDAQTLAELLDYDADSGALTWRPRPRKYFNSDRAMKVWNTRFAGTPAVASPTPKGYLTGCVQSVKYLQHRVIWKLVNGEEPEDVDHINGVRDDNRLCNLRSVRKCDNSRNRALSRNNKSGHHGVYASPSGRWIARIKRMDQSYILGTFDTKAEAVAARRGAEVVLGFADLHGRPPTAEYNDTAYCG